jgi:predicted DNA-binding protein with PD1-like motif
MKAAHEIQTGFRTRRTDFRFDSGSGRRGFCAISAFANEQAISAASVAAIGAFESAKVGWFDLAARRYNLISVDEQCEVLSLIGDIAQGDDGKASLHLQPYSGFATAPCGEVIF